EPGDRESVQPTDPSRSRGGFSDLARGAGAECPVRRGDRGLRSEVQDDRRRDAADLLRRATPRSRHGGRGRGRQRDRPRGPGRPEGALTVPKVKLNKSTETSVASAEPVPQAPAEPLMGLGQQTSLEPSATPAPTPPETAPARVDTRPAFDTPAEPQCWVL